MTPEEYAVQRQLLEAGRALHADFVATGRVSPKALKYLQALEPTIQAGVIEASAIASFALPDGQDVETLSEEHFATLVFGQYDTLRKHLDAAEPRASTMPLTRGNDTGSPAANRSRSALIAAQST